jgi:hypothetical protein
VRSHAALPRSGPDYVPATAPLGSGRYPAILESDRGLVTHTIYRPAQLDKLGRTKLPILAWANGGCANIGNRFRYFLTEIASHGYLAIAIGPMGSAAVESTPDSAPVINQPADPAQRVARQPVLRSPGYQQDCGGGSVLWRPASDPGGGRSARQHAAGAQQRHS